MNALDRPTILERYRDRIETNQRTKLTGDELKALVNSFIEQLKTLTTADEIQALCTAEMALLEEGYSEATVSKQYVPPYRKAIVAAAESGVLPMAELTSRRYTYTKAKSGETGEAHDHRALDFFKYSNEKYQQFAQASAERNNAKQDELQPIDPNKFVAKTITLLQSSNPFELAAGLAAATGRRFSEVVDKGALSATAAPYWVQFGGQLKKPTEADEYLAPCLIPAADVLTALQRFRKHRRIARLAGHSTSQINRSLANSVKRAVKRHFQDTQIVPVLAGEADVTIHNLRGVYGEIAVHYFCPPSQGTARFVQARLGHVISEEEFKRANATATQHYFHYYLVNENGQHIGSKGVMLATGGQPPAPIAADTVINERTGEAMLEPQAIEQTETAQPIETPETIEASELVAVSEPSTVEPSEASEVNESIDRPETTEPAAIEVENAPEQSEPSGATEADSSTPSEAIALLTEQIQSLSQTFTQEIQQLWSRMNEMQQSAPATPDTSFFTREIEALRQQLEDTQQERDQATAELEQVRKQNIQLQGRIASLQHEYELQRAADHQFFQNRIDQLTAIIRDTPPTPSTPPVTAQPVEAESQATPPQAEQAIAPVTNLTPQPQQTEAPRIRAKHSTVRGSADQRIEAAMLAIQEWNRHHAALDDKFAITQSLLQKVTGSNIPAVKRVMSDFANQITDHNEEHGLDSDRHNYAKDLAEIKRFVQARL